MKIGKHAIKLHKLIDDSAEMEAWVQKKIDLAGDYVKKVHGYMQGEGAGLYGEKAPPGREHQVKALKGKVDNPYAVAWSSYNKSKGKKEAIGDELADEGGFKDIDTANKEKARLYALLKQKKELYNAAMAGQGGGVAVSYTHLTLPTKA